MKTAIIYYSLEGNTKAAAQKISDLTGADIYEIIMHKSIPSDSGAKFFKGGMQAVFGICPPLKNFKFDENKYDRIILGTPVWAGKPASPINTLLRLIKDKNKITAVFTLSGSGNNKGCIAKLNKKCHSIKHTVSLADKANKDLSGQNSQKLNEFIRSVNGDNKNG
ncbi:MAG: flavodoxin [Oscillospiraceae bacterium]|nr:flavodoxin [Oscillospiraceae bacterium]